MPSCSGLGLENSACIIQGNRVIIDIKIDEKTCATPLQIQNDVSAYL